MSRRAKQPLAFAERLRVLRGNSGMTQWQIAQALNISRSAYAYYETGATRPDFDTLTRLAQIFRVSTDYLLGASPDPGGQLLAVQYDPSLPEPAVAELESYIDYLKSKYCKG